MCLNAKQRAPELTAYRERLVELATDFAEQAAGTSGAALRLLLEPWLEEGTIDKNSRLLTLVVRRVPTAAGQTVAGDWRAAEVERTFVVPRLRLEAA